MGKLIFKYGAMGSSKTAQALITRFNYLENNLGVWLIKPSTDTRDGEATIKSRIGLSAEADIIRSEDNILDLWENYKDCCEIIVADESQFFTKDQIEALRTIADGKTIVWCFGLKTNFKSELFEGSKRLIELADTIEEVKSICGCGQHAIINARLDGKGRVVTEGREVLLGGNDRYKPMCHKCYAEACKAALYRY